MRESEFWQISYLIYIMRGFDSEAAAEMADAACDKYDERFQQDFVDQYED